MRAVLHVVSIVLALPGLAFAAYVLALGHAIAGGDLWSVIDRLLAIVVRVADWGLVVACLALLVLAIAGVYPRSRPFAAVVVAALAAGATIVSAAHPGGTASIDDLPFLLPGALSFGIAVWIAWSEWPRTTAQPG
jgi:hypothetical protein